MPGPAPFLPDDSSIVFKQLTNADFVSVGDLSIPDAARFLGGRRANCIFGPDGTLLPVFQSYSRTWTSEGAIPEWPTGVPDSMSVTPAFLGSAELSRNDYSSYWDAFLEAAFDLNTYVQSKWRFAWTPGTLASSWDYFHFRWKIATYIQATDVTTEGDLMDFLWDRFMPIDYDFLDPLKWPGTPWVEAQVPDVTPDPATAANPSVSHYAQTLFKLKWPLQTSPFFVNEFTGTMRGIHGLTPGGKTERRDYLRPRIGPAGYLQYTP